jgi:hypothetical protein
LLPRSTNGTCQTQKTEERCQVIAVAVARFEIEKQKIFTVSQNSYPRRLSFRLQVVNKLSFFEKGFFVHKMKLSRTLVFWTIFVFFLLRLALSAEYQNVTEPPSITESVFKSELLRKLDLSKIFEEASNEIGLPFGLRQTLIETLREKGFLNLSGASYLFNKDRTDER